MDTTDIILIGANNLHDRYRTTKFLVIPIICISHLTSYITAIYIKY